jgi:hypothetical protein
MLETWAKVVGLKAKFKESTKDMLITGTFNLAEEFTKDKQLGNVKHVPMKTMWKAFRDDFGNVLEVVQLIDGQMHRLSPDYLIHYAINNPEEEYFGKSEIFSIAVPQKVTGDFDEDGNLIEADKYLVSILDRDARIRFSQLATAEKHAKSMMFVTVKGETNRDKINDLEKNLNSTDTRKWVTMSDKTFDVHKAQPDISSVMKDYTDDMKQQIAKAIGFPAQAIDEPSSSGFAASQTPIQEMMAQVAEMQKDLAELMENTIMRRKAEDWGFDFYEIKPRWTFSAFVEKITFEQLVKLEPSKRISDAEYRSALKQYLPDLNDDEFEKWQKQQKQEAAELMQQKQPGQGNGSSDDIDKTNPRPEIEGEAPKPDNTSAELLANHPLLKNPKAFESYVNSLVDKRKAFENFAQVLFKSTTGGKFETMPPGITEEDVEKALNEIEQGKPANEVFAGFKRKIDCIAANLHELDPDHYCGMFKGKTTSSKESDVIADNIPSGRQTGNTMPAKKKKLVKSTAKKTYESGNTFGDLQNEINPAEIDEADDVETTNQDKENIPTEEIKDKKKKTQPSTDEVFTLTSGTDPLK